MALQSATAGETMSNTFLTHRSYFDAHKAAVELRKNTPAQMSLCALKSRLTATVMSCAPSR